MAGKTNTAFERPLIGSTNHRPFASDQTAMIYGIGITAKIKQYVPRHYRTPAKSYLSGFPQDSTTYVATTCCSPQT
jgi:hypothetical protein